MLKSVREEVADLLLKLSVCLYSTGEIPDEYKKNIIVAPPEKERQREIRKFIKRFV